MLTRRLVDSFSNHAWNFLINEKKRKCQLLNDLLSSVGRSVVINPDEERNGKGDEAECHDEHEEG